MLNEKQLYISVITELELLTYRDITSQEIEILKEFLVECKIINLDDAIKIETINIRKKYNTKLPDSIIAATALFMDLPLITADIALKKIKELTIVLYEK